MFYQNDFLSLPARFQPRFNAQKSFRGIKRLQMKPKGILQPSKVTLNGSKEEPNFVEQWFVEFCNNTSVHGMKYMGQKNFHWSEK